MKVLASAVLFAYSKRRESRVCRHRGSQRGWQELVYVLRSLEMGILKSRCLGGIFVDILSQQFESQKASGVDSVFISIIGDG